MASAIVILDGEKREFVRGPQLATPLNPTSSNQTYFITPVHPDAQVVDEAFVMANNSQLEQLMRRRMKELRLQGIATRLNYSSDDVDEEWEMEAPPGFQPQPLKEMEGQTMQATYSVGQSYRQNPSWLDHSRGGYGNDADSPSPLGRWIEEL
nr:hypothetical protein [Tanacetum cinerariifolium]